jgi:hypothetical protein
LFNSSRSFPSHEEGWGASYWYEDNAVEWAKRRSRTNPELNYRVVTDQGRVVAVFNNGNLIQQEEVGRMPEERRFRADFWRGPESAKLSDPVARTGKYTPTTFHGELWQLGELTTLRSAEYLYRVWSEAKSAGTFKCCRIVELDDAGNILHVIQQSNEGDTAMGTAPNTAPVKPYTVKKERAVQKLEAERDRLKQAHDAAEAKIAEEHAARLAKIAKLLEHPYLVLRMFETCVGHTTSYENADDLLTKVKKTYGDEPGTAEFVVPIEIANQLNVLEVIEDETLEVQPTDNIYRYLEMGSPAAATTGTEGE